MVPTPNLILTNRMCTWSIRGYRSPYWFKFEIKWWQFWHITFSTSSSWGYLIYYNDWWLNGHRFKCNNQYNNDWKLHLNHFLSHWCLVHYITCLVVLLHNLYQSTSLMFLLEMCIDLTHTNMVALQLKLVVPLFGSLTIDNSLSNL